MRQLPLILASAMQGEPPKLVVTASADAPFHLAEHRALDVAASAGTELVLVGAAGEVRTLRFVDGTRPEFVGALTLADPRHVVFTFAPLSGAAKSDLFSASPRGLEVFRAGDDGAFAAAPIATAPRARFRLRTGVPMPAPMAQDIDGDGVIDVVVPDGESLDVWLQRPATGEGAAVAFTKGASVRVPASMSRSTGATSLSDRLVAGITIPSLFRTDVNGDGRLDIVVEEGELRAFHLVRADGSIPMEADSTLDLSIFRDTTAEASVAPGRTLAGLDRTLHEMRDLDGDKIPDHVIAHRRKVWVFRGTKEAPRFQSPTSILKTADDVTALLLIDLDANTRPDLVLLRVQVPSVATILRGLVAEWEVEVAAVGYRAGGERDFEPTPAWRSTLGFRVPAILSILKDPEAIVRKFEDAGKKMRVSAEGDVDGDGRGDALLVSEDATRIDVWLGDAETVRATRESPEEILRHALFDEEESTWDLDRLVGWFAGVAERRVQALTGNRPASGTLTLRPVAEWRLTGLETADVDGDGRMEAILRYDTPDGMRSAFDVVRWR